MVPSASAPASGGFSLCFSGLVASVYSFYISEAGMVGGDRLGPAVSRVPVEQPGR